MSDRIAVTAKEINEVAISLFKADYKLLAKQFGKMAADTATKNKGIAIIDKNSTLFKEIVHNRKVVA